MKWNRIDWKSSQLCVKWQILQNARSYVNIVILWLRFWFERNRSIITTQFGFLFEIHFDISSLSAFDFILCQNNLHEFIFSFNIISLLTAERFRCNFNKISMQASILRWKIRNVDFMWKIIEIVNANCICTFRQSIETINSIWIAYLFDWVYSIFRCAKKIHIMLCKCSSKLNLNETMYVTIADIVSTTKWKNV